MVMSDAKAFAEACAKSGMHRFISMFLENEILMLELDRLKLIELSKFLVDRNDAESEKYAKYVVANVNAFKTYKQQLENIYIQMQVDKNKLTI